MASESLMTQEEKNAFLNAMTLPDDGFKNYIKGELEKLISSQERDLMIFKSKLEWEKDDEQYLIECIKKGNDIEKHKHSLERTKSKIERLSKLIEDVTNDIKSSRLAVERS